jgi:hypothetical protein
LGLDQQLPAYKVESFPHADQTQSEAISAALGSFGIEAFAGVEYGYADFPGFSSQLDLGCSSPTMLHHVGQ